LEKNEGMKPERKLILYIAMSLDGCIASRDGNLDFLKAVEQEGEDYGYSEFVKTIDTVIIGRKSYDKVLSMGFEYPLFDKEVYILTHTERPAVGNLKYYTGSLAGLIASLKNSPGKDIYCDGGAEIVNELLRDDLIDEFIVSVIPVILGDGIKLFKNGLPGIKLELVSAEKFEKGLVQLHYSRVKHQPG
jgi:dihydrofolate reductase